MLGYIYKLIFKGTDKVYVGQTINIKRRFTTHLNKLTKGIHTKKLQEAYTLYGPPEIVILEECTKDLLDIIEEKFIVQLHAINEGFNYCLVGGNYSNLSGELSVHAKCTDDEYIMMFKELVHTNKTIKEIAEYHWTTVDIVGRIARSETHLWLKEEFPEDYKILLSKIGTRQLSNPTGTRQLLSPEGVVYTVDTLRTFAAKHSLTAAHVGNVLTGKRKQHKGWTKYESYTSP